MANEFICFLLVLVSLYFLDQQANEARYLKKIFIYSKCEECAGGERLCFL